MNAVIRFIVSTFGASGHQNFPGRKQWMTIPFKVIWSLDNHQDKGLLPDSHPQVGAFFEMAGSLHAFSNAHVIPSAFIAAVIELEKKIGSTRSRSRPSVRVEQRRTRCLYDWRTTLKWHG